MTLFQSRHHHYVTEKRHQNYVTMFFPIWALPIKTCNYASVPSSERNIRHTGTNIISKLVVHFDWLVLLDCQVDFLII